MADHRTHEPLEVIARLLERPGVLADLDLLQAGDRVVDPLNDLGVLLAQSTDVGLEPGGALEDLVVEPVGLLGDHHVLTERVADLGHLLQHGRRPVGDPPGSGGRDGLLEVHDRIVERLAALARFVQRLADLLVGFHLGHASRSGVPEANEGLRLRGNARFFGDRPLERGKPCLSCLRGNQHALALELPD